MAMDLVLGVGALVNESQLEEGADIGAVAGEGDEDGDVSGVVFGVFTVRVEVNCPLVTSHREVLAGDVLPNTHSLRQRVPFDCEVVGPIHRLRHRQRP